MFPAYSAPDSTSQSLSAFLFISGYPYCVLCRSWCGICHEEHTELISPHGALGPGIMVMCGACQVGLACSQASKAI